MAYVYDERTNEVLFKSYSKVDCINFISENYDDEHEDFPYIWLGE